MPRALCVRRAYDGVGRKSVAMTRWRRVCNGCAMHIHHGTATRAARLTPSAATTRSYTTEPIVNRLNGSLDRSAACLRIAENSNETDDLESLDKTRLFTRFNTYVLYVHTGEVRSYYFIPFPYGFVILCFFFLLRSKRNPFLTEHL